MNCPYCGCNIVYEEGYLEDNINMKNQSEAARIIYRCANCDHWFDAVSIFNIRHIYTQTLTTPIIIKEE